LTPLEDGSRLPQSAQGAFDLFVACDGKNSPVRDSVALQDPALSITSRDGRDGEELYKTVNFDLAGKADGSQMEEGWLYMIGGPPPHGVIASRLPSTGTGIGIVPLTSQDSQKEDLLEQRLSPDALALVSEEERVAFARRPVSTAAGGFVASRLAAGGCVAIVGDAATSPPPAGQGINHALEAASVLVTAVASASVEANGLSARELATKAVEAYHAEHYPSELAYAFLGGAKTVWQQAACLLGSAVGMHPWPGPAIKETTLPYKDLTSMHRFVGGGSSAGQAKGDGCCLGRC